MVKLTLRRPPGHFGRLLFKLNVSNRVLIKNTVEYLNKLSTYTNANKIEKLLKKPRCVLNDNNFIEGPYMAYYPVNGVSFGTLFLSAVINIGSFTHN